MKSRHVILHFGLFLELSSLVLRNKSHPSFLVSHDAAIYCLLDLVDPYGRHYGLPFRSRHRILDIILLELVLFDHILLLFLLGYFFIAGRLCINDVAQ